MSKLNTLTIMLLFAFTFTLAQSHEKKDDLKDLKGDVTKITVETTEDIVELTGEEAEAAYHKLKESKNKKIVFMHKESDHDGEMDITVDVNIDDEDGEKVVIIKKNIDGKEIVKEYKGKEAEKYFEEHSGEHNMKFISEDGDVHVIMDGDDDDLIWVSDNDDELMKKEINVEVVDGVKKVTVTTINDGEEKIEIYEGEEAEIFLESEKQVHNKIIKKKIIIKTEHEKNDNEEHNEKDED